MSLELTMEEVSKCSKVDGDMPVGHSSSLKWNSHMQSLGQLEH